MSIDSTPWRLRSLEGGELLWSQGEAADTVARVVRGRLRVVVDGHDLAEVGPGEVLAEEGQTSDRLYLVLEGGLASVGTPSDDLLGAGSALGAPGLVRSRPWRLGVVAGPEGAELLFLDREAWSSLEPDAWRGVSLALLELLRAELSQANAREAQLRGSRGNMSLDNAMVAPSSGLPRGGVGAGPGVSLDAAAGPYTAIEMNPTGPGIDAELARKGAVFISPHGFVGGPGTPGVLIMKRSLVRSQVPAWPGGGAVDFVTVRELQALPLYTQDVEHREEAGTPAIVESIRCGLVFQLEDQVGGHRIHELEGAMVGEAIRCWSASPAIDVLGPPDADRLSITSFLVVHGRQYLHYNVVVALLNDLFGLQARGGCSCAGPCGGMLLRRSEHRGAAFMDCVDDGWSSLEPGWGRVNVNCFISHTELAYTVDAVNLVALHGWALLPEYRLDPRSGLWTHRSGAAHSPQRLAALDFDGQGMSWPSSRRTLPEGFLARQLRQGRAQLEAAVRGVPEVPEAAEPPQIFEDNRWFPLPHEVAAWLRARNLEAPTEQLDPAVFYRAPLSPVSGP